MSEEQFPIETPTMPTPDNTEAVRHSKSTGDYAAYEPEEEGTMVYMPSKEVDLQGNVIFKPVFEPKPPTTPETPAKQEVANSRETLRAESGWVNRSAYESAPSQDTVLADDEAGVWIVADGVGGNADGQRASQLAVDTFAQYLKDNRETIDSSDLPATQLAAQTASQGIDAVIDAFKDQQTAAENPMSPDAATTFSAMFRLPNNKLGIVSIGDSSVFRLRKGKLEQLTEEQGERNVIFNSLSTKRGQIGQLIRRPHTKTDQYKVTTLQAGQEFLICSDGLLGDESYQKTPHEKMAETLINSEDPQTAADNLAALPHQLEALTGEDALMMAYVPQKDVPFLGWKKGVPTEQSFKAKQDDLSAVVVKFTNSEAEPAEPQDESTIDNPEKTENPFEEELTGTPANQAPSSSSEVISQRPSYEQPFLSALSDRIKSSERFGPLFEAVIGDDDEHAATILLKHQAQHFKADDQIGTLLQDLNDPNKQAYVSPIKSALSSNGATTETVADDLKTLKFAYRYLLDFPYPSDNLEKITQQIQERLSTIRTLAQAKETTNE